MFKDGANNIDLAGLLSIDSELTKSHLKIGNTYRNLGDKIYETIKNKIICHHFNPGERILDKVLAKQLGVSSSLVRQTLNALEKEELIVSVPRSGFYVRNITRKDVEDIYNIRNILEKHITREAIPKISCEELDSLSTIFAEAKKQLEKGKVKNTIKADICLHELLVNNCGNDHLKKLINSFNNHIAFYRIVDLSQLERARDSYFEHYQIFKTIEHRDIKLAVELMSKHINKSKKKIIDNFEDYTFGYYTDE